MSRGKEVLFLAHRIPFPPDKGDKIRSWRLLAYLAERYRVHLAAFVDDPEDVRHEARLAELCESATLVPLDKSRARLRAGLALATGGALSLRYFRDRRMAQAVARLRRRPLAAEIVFSSSMAQYVKERAPGRPRLVDFCDADSAKFDAYARAARGPARWLFAREARKLGAAETDIVNAVEASFAITPEEAGAFNHRIGLRRPVDWWRNGVDTAYFDPAAAPPPPPEPADVVFTGAMDYRANIDAALHFVAEIWPLVRARAPEARFAIVGARPVRTIRNLDGANGVAVTGRVDDIRAWIGAASVCVAPLRIARGMQNKVLEAMAMARPVVASPEAALGLGLEAGRDALIAPDPAAFADAVAGLLEDPARRAAIGAAARMRMETEFQWPQQLARFGAVLEMLAMRESAG